MIVAARRLVLAALVLLAPALAAAQTYTIAPSPFQTAFDNSGRIINNSCVWSYVAGTTTPTTTYATSTGTANSNPIRSDSAGRFTAFLAPGSAYKFVYESACTPPAHGTVLRTADGISAIPSSAASVDITGTAGESITAGQCVYLSNGDGGKQPSQWYKCDSANSYSSYAKEIGIATVNITAAGTGTIRTAGSVTGLTVNGGSDYYVGTAGALTSTAPSNARKLGQADSATSLVLFGNPPPPTALYSPSIATPTLTSPTITTSILSPLFLGCGIRLSLTSGTPVTTGDVTSAATVYAEPYSTGGIGPGICSFYDGSTTWTTLAFTETSIALGTLTSGLPYDVFCYNNSGTMACELLAWTNGSTRATALATQNGVPVKTGATTRRYIGTFYTTSTTTTEDSVLKRYLWNYYNRRLRPLRLVQGSTSWNYSTATPRAANNDAANSVAAIIGIADGPVSLTVLTEAYSAAASNIVQIGIGADVTNAFSTGNVGGVAGTGSGGSTTPIPISAVYSAFPAGGAHVWTWIEYATGGGTTTWNSGGASTTVQGGIQGWIEG